MPPLVAMAAAAAAFTVGARWLQREWRRVNAELERAEAATRKPHSAEVPTLRQDPQTGVWRPQ
jgi:hypothetical protein